jgi:hypothetical protein
MIVDHNTKAKKGHNDPLRPEYCKKKDFHVHSNDVSKKILKKNIRKVPYLGRIHTMNQIKSIQHSYKEPSKKNE